MQEPDLNPKNYPILKEGLSHLAFLAIQKGYPAHIAAGYDSLDALTFLKERGFDMEKKGRYGSRPIHEAAMYGSLKTLHALIEWKVNIGVENNLGETPLIVATHQKQWKAVMILEQYL